jgi:hypothetical protein
LAALREDPGFPAEKPSCRGDILNSILSSDFIGF